MSIKSNPPRPRILIFSSFRSDVSNRGVAPMCLSHGFLLLIWFRPERKRKIRCRSTRRAEPPGAGPKICGDSLYNLEDIDVWVSSGSFEIVGGNVFSNVTLHFFAAVGQTDRFPSQHPALVPAHGWDENAPRSGPPSTERGRLAGAQCPRAAHSLGGSVCCTL